MATIVTTDWWLAQAHAVCLVCDCDLNEWGGSVNYDFYDGSQWSNGLASYAAPRPARPDEKLGQPRWAGEVPQEPQLARASRIASRRGRLVARGLRENLDFTVSADGLHIYTTPCP